MEKDDFTSLLKGRLSRLVRHLFGEGRGNAVKFAESIQTSPGHVRDWLGESRPSIPSAAYLGRIYEAHGVNLNWLVAGDEAEPMLRIPRTPTDPAAKAFPSILPEHVQQAYALVKEGLGRHGLPILSEGYVVGSIAEGIAEGRSREYLLQKFSSLVQMAAQERKIRHQEK